MYRCECLRRSAGFRGQLGQASLLLGRGDLDQRRRIVGQNQPCFRHVIKEGEAPPPAITVRVCETLSCQMAGADRLREAVAKSAGGNVRVIGAPCIGRYPSAR